MNEVGILIGTYLNVKRMNVKGGTKVSSSRISTEDVMTTSTDGGLQSKISETMVWKDFLALIKIGIVNSNIITTFTGIWLALLFF